RRQHQAVDYRTYQPAEVARTQLCLIATGRLTQAQVRRSRMARGSMGQECRGCSKRPCAGRCALAAVPTVLPLVENPLTSPCGRLYYDGGVCGGCISVEADAPLVRVFSSQNLGGDGSELGSPRRRCGFVTIHHSTRYRREQVSIAVAPASRVDAETQFHPPAL